MGVLPFFSCRRLTHGLLSMNLPSKACGSSVYLLLLHEGHAFGVPRYTPTMYNAAVLALPYVYDIHLNLSPARPSDLFSVP